MSTLYTHDLSDDDRGESQSITAGDDDHTEQMLEQQRRGNVRAILEGRQRSAPPPPPKCSWIRKRLRIFGSFVFGIAGIASMIALLVFAIQHSQVADRADSAVPETLLVTLERATMSLSKGSATARVMYDYRSRKWRSDFQANAKFAHSILVDLSTCTQFVVHYSFAAAPQLPICQRITIDADVCAARREALDKGPQTSRLREVVVRGEILEQVTVDEQVTFTLRRRTAVPVAIHVLSSNDTFNVTDYAGGAFADREWAEAVNMCNRTTTEPTDWRGILERKCANDIDVTLAQRAFKASQCLGDDGESPGLPVLACSVPLSSLLTRPNCTTRVPSLLAWGRCAPCNANLAPRLLSVISHPDIGFFAPVVDRQWMMVE